MERIGRRRVSGTNAAENPQAEAAAAAAAAARQRQRQPAAAAAMPAEGQPGVGCGVGGTARCGLAAAVGLRTDSVWPDSVSLTAYLGGTQPEVIRAI